MLLLGVSSVSPFEDGAERCSGLIGRLSGNENNECCSWCLNRIILSSFLTGTFGIGSSPKSSNASCCHSSWISSLRKISSNGACTCSMWEKSKTCAVWILFWYYCEWNRSSPQRWYPFFVEHTDPFSLVNSFWVCQARVVSVKIENVCGESSHGEEAVATEECIEDSWRPSPTDIVKRVTSQGQPATKARPVQFW